jgi:hypothetical protein
MVYRYGSQVFLALSLLAFLAWIFTRFRGPLMGVSYEGFLLLATTSLMFVIAICLVQLAFAHTQKH